MVNFSETLSKLLQFLYNQLSLRKKIKKIYHPSWGKIHFLQDSYISYNFLEKSCNIMQYSCRILQDLVRFLQDTHCVVKFFRIIDFLQDSCKYLSRNALPGSILQEMCWLLQGLHGLAKILQVVHFFAKSCTILAKDVFFLN